MSSVLIANAIKKQSRCLNATNKAKEDDLCV